MTIKNYIMVKKKTKKDKKVVVLKTKSDRLTEVLEIFKKIQGLGLTDDYNGIEDFKNTLKDYVNDGEARQGKVKITGTKRIIEYILPSTQGRQISVNLKYDNNV